MPLSSIVPLFGGGTVIDLNADANGYKSGSGVAEADWSLSGNEMTTSGTGYGTVVQNWIIVGDSSNYELRPIVTGGDPNLTGGSNNVWGPASSGLAISTVAGPVAPDTQGGGISIDVRLIGTTNILHTGLVTVSAEKT